RTMRSLGPGSLSFLSSAASTSRAYQVGSPAAARAARDFCKKPRRDRFPLSIVRLPVQRLRWLGLNEHYDSTRPPQRKNEIVLGPAGEEKPARTGTKKTGTWIGLAAVRRTALAVTRRRRRSANGG